MWMQKVMLIGVMHFVNFLRKIVLDDLKMKAKLGQLTFDLERNILPKIFLCSMMEMRFCNMNSVELIIL